MLGVLMWRAQMSDRIVFEIPKNRREVIRLTRDTYKGHMLFSLRIWVIYGEGDIRPTKAGISIRPELLPDLLAGLQKAALSHQGGA